jgi:hypothetical protein
MLLKKKNLWFVTMIITTILDNIYLLSPTEFVPPQDVDRIKSPKCLDLSKRQGEQFADQSKDIRVSAEGT